MEFNCGDIVVVNFYPKKGDEVGKIRPAVIISGNDENYKYLPKFNFKKIILTIIL